MNYKQLQSSLCEKLVGAAINTQVSCYGHTISEGDGGVVLIDRQPTLFHSIDEAKRYIVETRVQQSVLNELHEEIYQDIPDNKIASIIRKYHSDVKITDTLIESYVQLTTSKVFNVDPVSLEIKKTNNLDTLIEGRFDFKLNDGTSIVITEELYNRINNIFGQHEDVIKYMRESAENFLSVVDRVED
jgi:hypothetical protein